MTSLDHQLERQGWKPQGDFWVSPYDSDDEMWVICKCGNLLATCYRSDLPELEITCEHCGAAYQYNQPYTLPMFNNW